jgi:hypothetical protein
VRNALSMDMSARTKHTHEDKDSNGTWDKEHRVLTRDRASDCDDMSDVEATPTYAEREACGVVVYKYAKKSAANEHAFVAGPTVSARTKHTHEDKDTNGTWDKEHRVFTRDKASDCDDSE